MKWYALEGNGQKLDGGAMFGNAPKMLWNRWFEADEKNRIPLSCRSLLIQTDAGKNILFEVGAGDFFDLKMKQRYGIEETGHRLLDELNKIGVPHNEIDQIVLSHLHFDHAGGLLSRIGDGNKYELLFPKAEIFVGARHFERAQAPDVRDQASFIPELQGLLKDSGRLKLIEGDCHSDLGENIRFRYVEGHTIGMIVSEIETSDGLIIFCADLIPGSAWVHIPIAMGYDRFPEKTVEEKTFVYGDWLKRGAQLFFTHDPKIAIGKLQMDPQGKYFV